MKYILPVLGLVLCTSANAEILGNSVKAGVEAWYTNTQVDKIVQHGNIDYDKMNYTAWARVEHILPVVPNFYARYNYLDTGSNNDKQDMNHFDMAAYYEVLDITPLKLDLGLGAKVGQFKYVVDNMTVNYENVLPFAYGHAELELFPSDFIVDATIEGVNAEFWKDTKLIDAQIGVSYKFGTDLIHGRAGLGYRYMYMTQEVQDKYNPDTEIKGIYASVCLYF